MEEVDKAYVAGLLDGEGSISVHRLAGNSVLVVVQISNTHMGALEWVQLQLGGTIKLKGGTPRFLKRNRECFDLRWRTQESTFKVLSAVYPYLKIKKAQAQIAIAVLGLLQQYGGKRGRGVQIAEDVRKRLWIFASECSQLNRPHLSVH